MLLKRIEYNLILRNWCELVRRITKHDPKLLKLFRITPNIRIKFGTELNDNLNRGLSTSVPHSDAWVEGPWGMNCFIPFFGDIKNVCKAYIGSKPIKAKITDPVSIVNVTAITGTRKFIVVDGFPLASSSGIKLINTVPPH